jgi:hypothetical protein
MQSRCFCLLLSAWLWLAPSAHSTDANPTNPENDSQLRVAIGDALNFMQPDATHQSVTIQRREDLEQEFLRISGTTATHLFFYEIAPRPGTKATDAFVSVALQDGSGGGAYQLYGFSGSEGIDELVQEFNRLASRLRLSISDAQTTALAQLFIRCCASGGPSELATDEDNLRHSVERYYLSAFGDTPRMLEASSRWWKGYATAAKHHQAPARNGQGHVALQRILLTFGADPELQLWDFQFSNDGRIQSVTVEPVFPQGGRWLFYDFRSNLKSFGATSIPPQLSLIR